MRRDSNEKKILVGRTEAYAIILEICLRDNYNRPENQHFSVSGIELNLTDVLTDETGEKRARDYLEDGEEWKMAVEAGRTAESMEDFNERVLNIDGWQHVVGDVEDIGDGKYVTWGSCGQIDIDLNPEDFTQLLISKEDLATIWHAWKTLHLKNVDKLKKKERALWNEVKTITEKYPAFEKRQILQFLD